MRAVAVVLLAVSACGRIGFDAPGTDAIGPASASCPQGWGAWQTPTRIDELDMAGANFSPSVTRDDLVLYFTSSRSGSNDVFRADRQTTSEPWGNITRLSINDDMEVDTDPVITAGGTRLYFTAFRGTTVTFVSTVSGSSYGTPVDVVELQGFAVWVSEDELDAWFAEDGHYTRPSTAVPFARAPGTPELGTGAGFFTFSADGLEVYFETGRRGRAEIFTSTRPARDQPFAPSQPVDIINDSQAQIGDPDLSFDGRTLRYNRDLQLMQTTRDCP